MYLERLKGGRNTKYLPELSFHLKVNIKNLIRLLATDIWVKLNK
ncbi:MAG: hypothetical protein BWY02_02597 [bacterium ADurb.Bin157]|nr:MAG: hypothetical protein BWY02_02597 [bacterium ADurb.Bin157]